MVYSLEPPGLGLMGLCPLPSSLIEMKTERGSEEYEKSRQPTKSV